MTVSYFGCKLVSHFDIRLVNAHPLKVKEPSLPTLRRSSFQEREQRGIHLLSQLGRREITGERRSQKKSLLPPRD